MWLLAHGLGGRTDLPLPVWMFGYGAAVTLVISFAALGLFWPEARLEGGGEGRVVGDPRRGVVRALVVLGRALGLAVFAAVVVAAAIGDDVATANLAPVVVYVTFWVGLTFISGLVGDAWRVLSPFETLAAGVDRLRGRPALADPVADPDDDPDEDAAVGGGLLDRGYWPAAMGLLAFVWLELVYPDRARPRALFVVIGAYTVAMLAAAAVKGRRWLRTGEAFAAFFGVVAHAAPLYRGDDGRLRLRAPLVGLARLRWRPGLEALVLVALGSTTFDGISRTRLWVDLTGDLNGNVLTLAATAGLLWAIGTVTLLYVASMRIAAGLIDFELSAEDLRAAFVHSLVPIVLAYSVAHYFSLFVLEGQAALARLSDPLGRGWDLFGTADWVVNFTLVTPRTVAYVQLVAIVVGHVAGVVLAHDRALVLLDKKRATRSQYPLLGAMVVFTTGGLVLLLGG